MIGAAMTRQMAPSIANNNNPTLLKNTDTIATPSVTLQLREAADDIVAPPDRIAQQEP
jgi:hypothetical protein